MFRKIRLRILGLQGIFYRVFIICCHTVFNMIMPFFCLLKGDLEDAFLYSFCWNMINMCLYYLYHYFWARLFRLERK